MGEPITQKTEIRFQMTQAPPRPDDAQRGDSAGIFAAMPVQSGTVHRQRESLPAKYEGVGLSPSNDVCCSESSLRLKGTHVTTCHAIYLLD